MNAHVLQPLEVRPFPSLGFRIFAIRFPKFDWIDDAIRFGLGICSSGLPWLVGGNMGCGAPAHAYLVDRLRAKKVQALHLYPFEAIIEHLTVIARPGDLIIVMGAGPVDTVGRGFLKA